MSEQIPSDKQRAARIALAVLAGALGTALVAGGLWLAFRPRPAKVPEQSSIEPAEETSTETTSAPGSADSTATTSTPPGDTKQPEKPGASGGLFGFGRSPRRAAKVAYRAGGKIWVAGENGKGAVAVCYGYRSYRLSPDGKVLAVVPDASEPLGPQSSASSVRLLDVRRSAVDAAPEKPSWAGTSAWLVFAGGSAGSLGSYRLDSSGAALRRLASPGSSPKASTDGKSVCFLRPPSDGGVPELVVASSTGGSPSVVGGSRGATSWDWGPGEALYFVRSGSQRGTWELWLSTAPYAKSSRVGSVDLAPPAFALADISVSRDGKRVLAQAMGDDDYSRLWVFDSADRRFHTISTRRDAYPYGWSADGSRVLYFEGNTYQGEPTALMSCKADGSGRRVVVEGAAR